MSHKRLWVLPCALVFANALSSVAQTSDPFAPTTSQDPAAIDQIWQKAVSKYDSPRTKILEHVDQVNAAGQFRVDWESLKNYQVPQWYQDAKFGIFLHWGVYSVPAFANEWYSRSRYGTGVVITLRALIVPPQVGHTAYATRIRAANACPS